MKNTKRLTAGLGLLVLCSASAASAEPGAPKLAVNVSSRVQSQNLPEVFLSEFTMTRIRSAPAKPPEER